MPDEDDDDPDFDDEADDEAVEQIEDRELPDKSDMDSFDEPSLDACPHYAQSLINEDAERCHPIAVEYISCRCSEASAGMDLGWNHFARHQLCRLDVSLREVAMKKTKLTHLDSRDTCRAGECWNKPVTAKIWEEFIITATVRRSVTSPMMRCLDEVFGTGSASLESWRRRNAGS